MRAALSSRLSTGSGAVGDREAVSGSDFAAALQNAVIAERWQSDDSELGEFRDRPNAYIVIVEARNDLAPLFKRGARHRKKYIGYPVAGDQTRDL